MNKELIKYVAIGLTGLVTGASIGYVVSTKRAQAKYRKLADEEIESVRQTYKLMRKEDHLETVEEAAKAFGHDTTLFTDAQKAMDEYQGVEEMDVVSAYPEADPRPDVTEIVNDIPSLDQTRVITMNTEIDEETGETRNIFDHGIDIDGEDLEKRGTDEPYIITMEEYMEDEAAYDKLTITYYEKDDVLADERDKPIPDVDGLIGSGTLNKFGHGSDSMNSVYVRNERISSDFEVVKDERSFTEVIYGVVERPEKQRPKKMRADE